MNKMIRKLLTTGFLLALASPLWAADYKVDGTHSFVEWRVQHLGYSWLYGRFNDISGDFSWDESNPAAAVIKIEIDTASLDSNHALRDKHLRGSKFLNVKQFPKATFVSTGFVGDAKGGSLSGDFTLHGITKRISFDVEKLGEGPDPWLGYRAGFIAKTVIDRRDYGIDEALGPMSNLVELELGVEGVRIQARKKHKQK